MNRKLPFNHKQNTLCSRTGLWLILDWDVSSDSLHSALVEEYSDSSAQLIDQVAADTELLQVPAASYNDNSEQVRQPNEIL